MFGPGMLWGSPLSGGDALNNRERHPPARPIPLEFPCYVPRKCGSPLSRQHSKLLRKDLLSVRRPIDVADDHLAHFNIDLCSNVELPDLVPEQHFESRPFLYDGDLTAMLAELGTDNEDAYREILRLPPKEGKAKPRLAYSRNFFASLEDMSRYWDTSLDNYYEIEETQQTDDESKPATTEQKDDHAGEAGAAKDSDMSDGSAETQSSVDPGLTQTADALAEGDNSENTVQIPSRPKMKPVYKGQRLGNGEQMSPGTRIAAIRNLLKMVVHKFNSRDFELSPKEKFRIRSVNLPSVYYSFCVARLPSDSKLARARMVEGPILAVHSRSEVRFKSRDGLLTQNSEFTGERYDLFREIGSGLMLAMQRAREGRKPPEASDEQWWATKVRWGGGETRWGQLASEVYEDEDPSWSPEERRLQLEKREKEEQEGSKLKEAAAAAAAVDPAILKPEDLMARASTTSERPKKKKRGDGQGPLSDKDKAEYREGKRLVYTAPMRRRWHQQWVTVRPNAPSWDDKIIFKRVGAQHQGDARGAWDDVYMVSAVNHHACLMKLTVHESYIEWLENGQVTREPPANDSTDRSDAQVSATDRQEHILYVRRSKWYDLFDVEERKELLIGLWRIMSWINRDVTPREEFEKMEELRREMEGDAGDHHMEI